MDSRQHYYSDLCADFCSRCQRALAQFGAADEEAPARFAEHIDNFERALRKRGELCDAGQALVGFIVHYFPQFMPELHRDLLWYFGGDCLHYLGDEELDRYQTLDDSYFAALETPGDDSPGDDYREQRARVFGLH